MIKKVENIYEAIDIIHRPSPEDRVISFYNFAGIDFNEADLSGKTFRYCNFTGCDFTSCNLLGSNFSDCKMKSITVEGCDLRGVSMRDTVLSFHFIRSFDDKTNKLTLIDMSSKTIISSILKSRVIAADSGYGFDFNNPLWKKEKAFTEKQILFCSSILDFSYCYNGYIKLAKKMGILDWVIETMIPFLANLDLTEKQLRDLLNTRVQVKFADGISRPIRFYLLDEIEKYKKTFKGLEPS